MRRYVVGGVAVNTAMSTPCIWVNNPFHWACTEGRSPWIKGFNNPETRGLGKDANSQLRGHAQKPLHIANYTHLTRTKSIYVVRDFEDVKQPRHLDIETKDLRSVQMKETPKSRAPNTYSLAVPLHTV